MTHVNQKSMNIACSPKHSLIVEIQYRQRGKLHRFNQKRLINVLGKRLQDAVPSNVLHSVGYLLHESLVVTQIVTEQTRDAQQLGRLSTTSTGLGLKLLTHGVIDSESVTLVINTIDVAEPSSSDEAQTAERALHPDGLGNRGHDELGDLAGRVETDTGQLVHDGRVGETFHEGLAVLIDIDTRDLRQGRLDLFLHHLPDELVEVRIFQDLVDVVEACHLTGVSNSGVTAVKETELVLLELFDRVHVLDDLDADLLEGRATVGELIFNDPLHERFRDDRPGVLNTHSVCEGLLIGGRRLRSDTVDHSVGESTFISNPLSDFGVAETGERLEHVTGDGTILLHVIARHDGEGHETLLVTAGEGSVEETEGSTGGLFVGGVQVELNVRVLTLELVSVLIVVVTALSDGERHDAGIRVRHLSNDGFAIIRSKEVGIDAANDVGKAALGRTFNDGVEIVLGTQGIAHGGIEGLKTNTADSVVCHAVILHQLVNVDGQVRTMETAHTDVDNSLLEGRAAPVGRDLNAAGTCRHDLRQIRGVKLERTHCVWEDEGGRRGGGEEEEEEGGEEEEEEEEGKKGRESRGSISKQPGE